MYGQRCSAWMDDCFYGQKLQGSMKNGSFYVSFKTIWKRETGERWTSGAVENSIIIFFFLKTFFLWSKCSVIDDDHSFIDFLASMGFD